VLTSAAAPILLIGGWTLAARLQSGHFDQVRETISDLAADDADHRWVMTAALAGVGACHVGTALALKPATRASRMLLGVGGIATALVAAYPLPVGRGPAPQHAAAAGLAFGALGAWPAISWRRARRRDIAGGADVVAALRPEAVPAPFRPEVAIPAGGVLLTALGWFLVDFVDGGERIGFSERVAAGLQAIWPLVAVLAARRSSPARRSSNP
jgi:hypothetical membrane protein